MQQLFRDKLHSVFYRRKHYTDKQRITFFKQLAIILSSGLPLLKGLNILGRRVDKNVGEISRTLERYLYKGLSLSDAMKRCGNFFSPLATTLTAAGEESGELNVVLEELAEYYTRQHALKNFLIKSCLYPAFVLIAAMIVMLFFLFYILPVLAGAYFSLRVPTGGILQYLLDLHNIITEKVYLISSFAVSFTCVMYFVFKRYLLNRLSTWPLVGNLYITILEVRTSKLLALLLESGISITDAVTLVQATIEDRAYLQKLQVFSGRIQRGFSIAVAASSSPGLFSPLGSDMIAVGEATGYLPKMLRESAEIDEKDLTEKLEKAKEVIAPLLLLIAALVVGLVVCSVIGPLFNLLSALPEGA